MNKSQAKENHTRTYPKQIIEKRWSWEKYQNQPEKRGCHLSVYQSGDGAGAWSLWIGEWLEGKGVEIKGRDNSFEKKWNEREGEKERGNYMGA